MSPHTLLILIKEYHDEVKQTSIAYEFVPVVYPVTFAKIKVPLAYYATHDIQ